MWLLGVETAMCATLSSLLFKCYADMKKTKREKWTNAYRTPTPSLRPNLRKDSPTSSPHPGFSKDSSPSLQPWSQPQPEPPTRNP